MGKKAGQKKTKSTAQNPYFVQLPPPRNVSKMYKNFLKYCFKTRKNAV